MSDLHLERGDIRIDVDCDILVLAGDVHTGTRGLLWIIQNFPDLTIIYVLGNHEYYTQSYPDVLTNLRKLTEETNIHILDNESFTIDDVTFHGSTLWSDFNLFKNPERAMVEGQLYMNDYCHIQYGEELLKPEHTLELHKKSRAWLEKSLATSNSKINIVVTHFAPSIQSVETKYRVDGVTPCFASNLESLIEDFGPDYWFHGHTHSFIDYKIGNTRIVCNPQGYPYEDTGVRKMIIEV